MIKLIATDMDGTFLNSEKEFDPRFIDIFHELNKLGIRFVVASGQQYYRLYQRFMPMSEQMCFIAENGTYVALGSQKLFANEIERDFVNRAIEVIEHTPRLVMIMCGTKSAYIENKYRYLEDEVKKYYCMYEFVDSLSEVDDEIIKLAIYDPQYHIEELLDQVKAQLPEQLKIVTSGNEWMDITNKEANKGLSMIFLEEYFGVHEDEAVAFGDQMNDYELLQSVKYSFAMDNAVDAIKAIAYDTVPSNIEQGVLIKLEEIVQNHGEIIENK
ncbi:HAD family hydrolase [[Clostridium] spiroforme]|nr:HAD family hydrolase [Thomasclavelia spiroformis]